MKKKSVIIATPLFPPQVGGPATHAKAIYDILREENMSVYVQNFSDSFITGPSYRIFSRHYLYTIFLFINSIRAQTIIAFDELAVGVPSALVSLILRKKFILRIGGDRLWEKAVQEGKFTKPLPDFCNNKVGKKLHPFLYRLVHFVMNRAQVIVFPSAFYRDLAVIAYGISSEKTVIIENALLHKAVENNKHAGPKPLHFIYAGRFSKVKNLPLLLQTFSHISEAHPTAHLTLYGEGPEEKSLRKIRLQFSPQVQNAITIKSSLPHHALTLEIQKSYACVLPSLSEASPNFAFECDALSTPTLITKYAGGREHLAHAYPIDPTDETELIQGFLYLLRPDMYEELINKKKEFTKDDEVYSRKWLKIIKSEL